MLKQCPYTSCFCSNSDVTFLLYVDGKYKSNDRSALSVYLKTCAVFPLTKHHVVTNNQFENIVDCAFI